MSLSIGQSAANVHARFLDAIYTDPDRFENYGVYSDWLADQGDPRGELIQLQWMLEQTELANPIVFAERRRKAKLRQHVLLYQNQRRWLAELESELVDQRGPSLPTSLRVGRCYQFTFARGFLDSLRIAFLVREFAEKLGQSECTRLLRQLHILRVDVSSARGGAMAPLDVLAKSTFANVRRLRIGDSCDNKTRARSLHQLVAKMPRLETLHVEASVDTPSLFAAPMPNLKTLAVHHLNQYPLEILANNPSLSNLETIAFCPARQCAQQEPAIQLFAIQQICRSHYLTNLRHIHMACTNFGDAGIREFVRSGILDRLETLQLPRGATTDEGAKLLVDCGIGNLKRLDLTGHYLSPWAVRELESMGNPLDPAGTVVSAEDQIDSSRPRPGPVHLNHGYGGCPQEFF